MITTKIQILTIIEANKDSKFNKNHVSLVDLHEGGTPLRLQLQTAESHAQTLPSSANHPYRGTLPPDVVPDCEKEDSSQQTVCLQHGYHLHLSHHDTSRTFNKF